eukprot:SAG25_NODE_377_length_8848_cov_2.965367_6_plen_96_part_00
MCVGGLRDCHEGAPELCVRVTRFGHRITRRLRDQNVTGPATARSIGVPAREKLVGNMTAMIWQLQQTLTNVGELGTCETGLPPAPSRAAVLPVLD